MELFNLLRRYKRQFSDAYHLLLSVAGFLIGYNFIIPFIDSDTYNQIAKLVRDTPSVAMILDFKGRIFQKLAYLISLITFAWFIQFYLWSYGVLSIEQVNKVGQSLGFIKVGLITFTSVMGSLMLGAILDVILTSNKLIQWILFLLISIGLIASSYFIKRWLSFQIDAREFNTRFNKEITWALGVIAFSLFIYATLLSDLITLYSLFDLALNQFDGI